MKNQVYSILKSKGIAVSEEDYKFLVDRLSYIRTLNSTLKDSEMDELDISIKVLSKGAFDVES